MNRLIAFILKISALVALIIVLTLSVIYNGTRKYIYSGLNPVPYAEYAVIPGAAILKSGDLSPVLKDRADKAIELFNAHKVGKILVTGNNGDASYDEVDPIRIYLQNKGISPQDIVLDRAGFDTYSSMYRAQSVFNAASMVVVSQSFHLPRAVFIARRLGIEAYGLSADRGHYLVYNYLREIPADIKAAVNLAFQRKPEYLGTTTPVK